ncbi:PH domain-containing protein [Actinophytocola sp.]|uniref:PH domain-containing protein n=1 Tax=Actinophytocola sp. TaxID=1872138 RepID=UPI003D6A8F71
MSFVVRPRRVRLFAGLGAVVLFAMFAVAGVFLRESDTGVNFRLSDQIAMVGIGLFLALGALWFTRPRVRADRDGVEVRNMLGARRFSWSEIEQVSFPDGSPWARLELPHDEYVPMVAIQALDGERAVAAMRELRRVRREATESPRSPR